MLAEKMPVSSGLTETARAGLRRLAGRTDLLAVLSGMAEAALVTDDEGRILWINAAAEDLLGFRPDELRGRDLRTLTADPEAGPAGAGGMAAGPDAWAVGFPPRPVRFRHRSGKILATKTSLSPIRLNRRGPAAGTLAVIRDATPADRMHESLSRLSGIAADRTLRGARRIAAILRVGCDHFGLPWGSVAQVAGETATLRHDLSFDGPPLRPGSALPVADLLLVETFRSPDPVMRSDIDDAAGGAAGSGADRVAPSRVVSSHIGARLVVDGAAVGVTCFSGPDARPDFSRTDADLVRLLSSLIAHEVDLQQTRTRLTLEASTDWLTEALNRRAFLPHLSKALGDRRRGGLTSTLVLLDLDRFKDVNDRYGHVAGDKVLRIAVSRIGRVSRAGGVVGRLGGEEFGVLLHGADADRGRILAERMRRALSDEPIVTDEGCSLTVTASFGVAEADPGHERAEHWLAAADKALYEAKAKGRDRVILTARPPRPPPAVSGPEPAVCPLLRLGAVDAQTYNDVRHLCESNGAADAVPSRDGGGVPARPAAGPAQPVPVTSSRDDDDPAMAFDLHQGRHQSRG